MKKKKVTLKQAKTIVKVLKKDIGNMHEGSDGVSVISKPAVITE